MAKIKIKDLPKDMKISQDELKRIRGGAYIMGGEVDYNKYKDEIDILSIDSPLTIAEKPL